MDDVLCRGKGAVTLAAYFVGRRVGKECITCARFCSSNAKEVSATWLMPAEGKNPCSMRILKGDQNGKAQVGS